MCRWIAYSGSPIRLDELLLKRDVSLIDQSLSARLAVEPTNGDGFGVGWYSHGQDPGVYRETQPAWNDRNLCDLAHYIESPLFVAHVRRATGTPVQRSNCHPFRHGRWLFVHNGVLGGFERVKRDLAFAVDPALYPSIEGTTDSELMFHLALTFGLEDEPLPALERMTGYVEQVAREHGIEHPVQMTLGVADGARLFAVRYSSEGRSRTLFHSASIAALRELHPNEPELDVFPEDARAVVSEPLSDSTETWIEIPESSALVIEGGAIELRPFEPRLPG